MAKLKVGCKLPNGLRCEVDVGDGKLASFTLEGQWRSQGAGLPALLLPHGVTEVDEDLYNLWFEQNKSSTIVREGLVFAETTLAKLESEAKELSDQTSGLEQLSQTAVKDAGLTKLDSE